MSTAPAEVVSALQGKFAQVTARPSADHPAVNVPLGNAVELLRHLRDERGFDFLVDVTGIDWDVEAAPRFSVVWHLFSTRDHGYLRVVAACVGDNEPVAPSVVELWPAANWHERETYDLLGIRFEKHPDLRRILMWDGYPFHPLRKDFPLAGIDTPLPDLEVGAVTNMTAQPVPMVGGPFVASTGEMNLTDAEPRAKDESWDERKEKPATGSPA
jgi:NADH-quinone oxidoreductase subunit C